MPVKRHPNVRHPKKVGQRVSLINNSEIQGVVIEISPSGFACGVRWDDGETGLVAHDDVNPATSPQAQETGQRR